MALLKKKKDDAKKEEKKDKKVSSLMKPRITEKATMLAGANVYAFDLAPGMNKLAVAAEVKKVHGVTPVDVRVVTVPSKRVFVRGKWGVKQGGRKAYVQLKKGDTIEFV